MTTIQKAAAFAAERHVGQVRKGPISAPYVTHCEEVAKLVATHGAADSVVIAAWLHDTVEDTATTAAEIAGRFGAEVAALVDELTDDPTLSKAERQAAQIASGPGKSRGAAMIKAADQTSNMRSLVASPPDWSVERRAAYVAKCRAVVTGLMIPDGLRSDFEAAADAAADWKAT